jgi:hypothetical protein
MTINVYQKGDTVRVSAAFRNTAGDLADPAVVTFWFTTPSEITTDYVYGVDAELVKDSAGMYHVDILANQAYRWKYQFHGSGNNIEMVEKDEFDVEPSAFV